ncbi:MAG: hypothetical protein WKF89_16910 [Chitinophagaceae bacterium]
MPDYNQLKEMCNKGSKISTAVIDEFILHYAAKRDKLDQEFEAKISRFTHAEREMPSSWTGLITAQYIGHKIFKEQGLITRYLNHAAIRDLDSEQQNYLRLMAVHPWRFSFSEIKANPARDFYVMQDIFTRETYLLYSTSVSQILLERPVLSWFNLIGFNGDCWQTYGPVTGFQSFGGDDIFFYASELNGSIESAADLMKDLENNPVPYMMLMTGSVYPLVQNGGFEILHVVSEIHAAAFDMQTLRKTFKVEYAEGVYRLSDKIWSEPPHFSAAYYDEGREIMLLSALTDRGYLEMAKKLHTHKIKLPVDPDIRLHLPMLTVIKQLLRKDPKINPYSRLFATNPSPENEAMMAKLNEFLSLAMAAINAGKNPDINAMAKKIGIDPETAKDLFQQSINSIKKLRK